MESFIKYCIGVVAVAALVLGLVAYNRPVSTVAPGATPGANDQYPCKNSNGVGSCRFDKPLTVATTTICAAQSPNATSTLSNFAVRFTTSSTTATTVTIASATTAFATTTAIGSSQTAIAAGGQATIVASSSIALAPLTWIVVGMQGGVSGNFSPSGYCQGTFETIGYPNFNY